MAVIGVTGLPGAGKSCVAELFASGGGNRVDVDAVGHAVLEDASIRAQLRSHFGLALVPEGVPIDRAALGRLVFSDPAALRALERIVHPPMGARIRASIEAHRTASQAGTAHLVVDAAVLYRMHLDADCDRVVHVCAPFALRLARVRGRGWDAEMLRRRDGELQDIAAHAVDADAVIENDKPLMELKPTILHLAKEWQ